MLARKLEATIGKDGILNLQNLPFHEGETVEVVILKPETVAKPKRRTVGEYVGQIRIADDFAAPLPDEFWLGERS